VARAFLSRMGSAIFLFLVLSRSAQAQEWRPVNPADLASKTAVVEKDADAEALFWEVRLDDGEIDKTILRHYLRLKVFTSRGVESQGRVDLPYTNGVRIADITARTVKPDGTVVELKKDAIFDRTIVKISKVKLRAKSFAMPGVEPGAIIEYQWREERESLGQYTRLEFQRDIPVRSVKYFIKPFVSNLFPFPMLFTLFHMPNIPLEKEKNGFSSFTLNNVPAFREEPYMPPESEVRPWILVYYAEPENLTPNQYWGRWARTLFDADKADLKVNDDIRKATKETIGTATDPEEKLRKLFDFVRTKVTNPYDDASGYKAEDIAKVKQNNSPADTLKRGVGTPLDIDILFGVMAMAAGFDVRVARLSDRSDIFFDPASKNSYFLSTYDIAVKVGDRWRFFNPGNRYVPFGMLSWSEENVPALIPDSKEVIWVTTPMSQPDKSTKKRIAKLRLLEDGTLEGDVQVEYTGHFASEHKEYYDGLTAAEQEKEFMADVQEWMSTAQVSAVVMENAKDPSSTFTVRYHVRVPQYAQRTGRRLFFQPGFFDQGTSAVFTSANRTFAVSFPHPWSEQDDLTIELPAGFELENPEAPAGVRAGNAASLEVKMSMDGRTLKYERKFVFGGGTGTPLLFPPSQYKTLKDVFDMFHQRNTASLTLREISAAPR